MRRLGPLALPALLLAACGGGGGASNVPGTPVGPFSAGVAYLADGDVDGRVELYVAALDGSAFRKVSAPLPVDGGVLAFAWSPDRARVAYLADSDGDFFADALFVADPDGAPAVRVSLPLAAGTRLEIFGWGPDSAHLAYSTFEESSATGDLWTTPATGASPMRVSGPSVPGRWVGEVVWSPSSLRLAYRTIGGAVPSAATLSLVDVDGSDVATLGFSPMSSWAPDGGSLAYDRVGDVVTGAHEVVIASSSGVTTALASGTIAGRFGIGGLIWSPDSSHLAWQTMGASGFVETLSLWSAGGGSVLVSGLAAQGAALPAWAPDSLHVAYVEALEDPGLNPATGYAVHVAAPDGTHAPVTSSTFAGAERFAWVDASRFVFTGVYAAEVGGTDATGLVGGESPVVAPDGSAVACLSHEVQGVREVWVGPVDTTYGARRVSVPLYPPLRVSGVVQWTRDSSRVVYTATPTGIDVVELFASARDGSAHVRLSGPMVTGGQVTSFDVR